jgi:hypothetical protein
MFTHHYCIFLCRKWSSLSSLMEKLIVAQIMLSAFLWPRRGSNPVPFYLKSFAFKQVRYPTRRWTEKGEKWSHFALVLVGDRTLDLQIRTRGEMNRLHTQSRTIVVFDSCDVSCQLYRREIQIQIQMLGLCSTLSTLARLSRGWVMAISWVDCQADRRSSIVTWLTASLSHRSSIPPPIPPHPSDPHPVRCVNASPGIASNLGTESRPPFSPRAKTPSLSPQ